MRSIFIRTGNKLTGRVLHSKICQHIGPLFSLGLISLSNKFKHWHWHVNMSIVIGEFPRENSQLLPCQTCRYLTVSSRCLEMNVSHDEWHRTSFIPNERVSYLKTRALSMDIFGIPVYPCLARLLDEYSLLVSYSLWNKSSFCNYKYIEYTTALLGVSVILWESLYN